MTWELIWKIVFIVVLSLFAVMAVAVTVLGARDVRKLLARLKDEQSEDDE